ncbi:hypothetical protein [Demequina flava]|uniref:hypothetical protein n=1 Tax=Demequina flava TaxID=1095025 RepID=UPI00078309B7|nr:hypothetical protein [Demequina flava]
MTLTDRYIAATAAKLPEDQRADVSSELTEAIGDAIDAHLVSTPQTTTEEAERHVLNTMGDPEKLAATYADRSLFLIGPELFLQWKRLTVSLLWIVLPIIAILIPVAGYLDGTGVWAIIGQTWGGTLTVGVYLVFWVTVVFAAMERTGTKAAELSEPWTVDNLKTPTATVVMGDTIGAAATLVVTAVFIIWQQVYPWAHDAAGEGLPLINPGLWTFVLPALLAVMAIELVVVIARQVRGHWTRADAWVTLGLNIATTTVVAMPLLQHTFLNRDLFTEIGWPDGTTTLTLENIEMLTLLVLVIVAVVDVVLGFRKAARATPSRA